MSWWVIVEKKSTFSLANFWIRSYNGIYITLENVPTHPIIYTTLDDYFQIQPIKYRNLDNYLQTHPIIVTRRENSKNTNVLAYELGR